MPSPAVRHTGRSAERVETCGLFATAVLAFALPCFLYDLNLPDEPRVAHTSFEMLRTADFVVPAVNGEAFLHTPPCFYWLLALWFWLVGTEPDGVARLLPVACASGTLIVVFLLTRRRAGRRAALLSVAVLASMFQFWDIGHRVTVDMALTLFTTAALLCLVVILLEPRFSPGWAPLLGLLGALAFLAKGVVGPGILSLVLVAMLVRHRDLWTRARITAIVIAAVTAVLALLPWLAALHLRDPSYPSLLEIEHVWERAVDGLAHDPSNWQFLHRMLLHLMPWTIILPLVFHGQARQAWGRSRTDDRDAARFTEFLFLSFLLPLIVLLISRGKRNLYLLPALPAVAMLAGVWLERHLDARLPERLVAALVWTCGLGGAAGLVATLLVAPAHASGLVFVTLIVNLFWSVRWLRRRRREKRQDSSESEPASVPPTLPDGPAPARGALDASICTALVLIILCVAAWGSFYHVLRNPRYTAAPLGLRVAALENQGYEIIGLRLFEREAAAVAWYLRHPFPNREEPDRRVVEEGSSERPLRLALLVEAGDLEALGPALSGWKEVCRERLRRREIVVMARE